MGARRPGWCFVSVAVALCACSEAPGDLASPGSATAALRTPPPISGGTLLATRDGARVVAADPDLDRVAVVDARAQRVTAMIDLSPRDEPGRLVEDGAGRVHVVLRGAGAVATIDVTTGRVLARRPVCAEPRGLAWNPSGDVLHVACAGGELVTLPAEGSGTPRTVRVARDLRDVVVVGDRLLVTRFRTAETLVLDASGAVTSRVDPARLGAGAGVAWRMTPNPAGGAWVLHARGSTTNTSPVGVGAGGYNQGAGSCGRGGIVRPGMALVRPPQDPLVLGDVQGAPLAVDVAVSPSGGQVALAVPGNLESDARGTVLVLNATQGSSCQQPDHVRMPVGSQAVAVVYTRDGALVAQTRAPAAIVFAREGRAIALGGPSMRDPGHDLFHTNATGVVTCAGCHPEGDDDGRTWSFASIGPRRTQTIRGGIADTAPFHWDGDMRSFTHLVSEVLVGRMGAPDPGRLGAVSLAAWVDQLPARPAPAEAMAAPDHVARGAALFHDPTVACASCHAGDELTDNRTVDVGTGGAFQVPTLRGLAWRAPYMHDGCAPTLRDRFTLPCGGGDRHGRTSQLTSAQVDDLVAYLETL